MPETRLRRQDPAGALCALSGLPRLSPNERELRPSRLTASRQEAVLLPIGDSPRGAIRPVNPRLRDLESSLCALRFALVEEHPRHQLRRGSFDKVRRELRLSILLCLGTQDIRKELVTAVPFAPVIEGNQELLDDAVALPDDIGGLRFALQRSFLPERDSSAPRAWLPAR